MTSFASTGLISLSDILVPTDCVALGAIDAPYIKAYIKAMRGNEHIGSPSVFIRVSLQPREEWKNGIFENSPNLHVAWRDGKLEAITRPCNMPTFRKCNATTPEEVVHKINRYIAKVRAGQ